MQKKTTKLGLVALAAALGLAACGGNNSPQVLGGPGGSNLLGAGPYQQVDRLNRPAVNEVLAIFARHDVNNRDTPNDDAANLKNDIVTFMTNTAGRSPAVANTLAAVLVPDVQIADMSGTSQSCIGSAPGTCNNYLGIESGGAAQAPGGLKPFGGRALTDDVVDTDLAAIFGTLLTDCSKSAPCTNGKLGLVADDGKEQDGRPDAAFPSGKRPQLTTDGVSYTTAPKHFTASFPYVGAPQ